jgi:hypothetical protein
MIAAQTNGILTTHVLPSAVKNGERGKVCQILNMKDEDRKC